MMTSNILVIGSRAMAFNGVDTGRRPKDWDFICTKEMAFQMLEEVKRDGNRVIQVHEMPAHQMAVTVNGGPLGRTVLEWAFPEAYKGSNAEILALADRWPAYAWAPNYLASFAGLTVQVADIHILYLLKMSHRYKKNSPHFLKTMDDIHLLRNRGAFIIDQGLYEARMKATYDYGHPKLNQGKTEFFTDSVPYIYDHDTIHEAVKHLDRPAYTMYAVDGEEVKSDRQKFEALPHSVRLLGVLEESYVLALERAIIPHNADPYKSFKIALMKVCTSITSGWFREFAWENYNIVHGMYNEEFVTKFKAALAAGQIKPYERNVYA